MLPVEVQVGLAGPPRSRQPRRRPARQPCRVSSRSGECSWPEQARKLVWRSRFTVYTARERASGGRRWLDGSRGRQMERKIAAQTPILLVYMTMRHDSTVNDVCDRIHSRRRLTVMYGAPVPRHASRKLPQAAHSSETNTSPSAAE